MLNADGSAGALLSSLFLSRNLRQLHYRTTHNGTVSCTVNECVAGIDNCRAAGELSVQRAGSAALGGSRSPSAPAPPQTPSGCIGIGENQHRTAYGGSVVRFSLSLNVLAIVRVDALLSDSPSIREFATSRPREQ